MGDINGQWEDEAIMVIPAAGTGFSISCIGIDAGTKDRQIENLLACAANLNILRRTLS